MPIDRWIPTWDARSSHHIDVAAEPAAVYQALLETDFGRNPVVRMLMGLRQLPALLLAPRAAGRRLRELRRAPRHGPHGNLLAGAFTVLELAPPTEMVFGLAGRFWRPSGELVPTSAELFPKPPPAGVAHAAWSFSLEPVGPGRTRLHTETRVVCGDAATRRSFLRYWRVIRGGSGLIRWALLRQVKREAERG